MKIWKTCIALVVFFLSVWWVSPGLAPVSPEKAMGAANAKDMSADFTPWASVLWEVGEKPQQPLQLVTFEQFECLALNIYWESRGQPERGQHAVAHVTLNRVSMPGYPDTICAVVKQSSQGQCQFSWVCDDLDNRPQDQRAWKQAMKIAMQVLVGSDDPTQGALFFHHTSLNPSWARNRVRPIEIGDHIFFSTSDMENRRQDQLAALKD